MDDKKHEKQAPPPERNGILDEAAFIEAMRKLPAQITRTGLREGYGASSKPENKTSLPQATSSAPTNARTNPHTETGGSSSKKDQHVEPFVEVLTLKDLNLKFKEQSSLREDSAVSSSINPKAINDSKASKPQVKPRQAAQGSSHMTTQMQTPANETPSVVSSQYPTVGSPTTAEPSRTPQAFQPRRKPYDAATGSSYIAAQTQTSASKMAGAMNHQGPKNVPSATAKPLQSTQGSHSGRKPYNAAKGSSYVATQTQTPANKMAGVMNTQGSRVGSLDGAEPSLTAKSSQAHMQKNEGADAPSDRTFRTSTEAFFRTAGFRSGSTASQPYKMVREPQSLTLEPPQSDLSSQTKQNKFDFTADSPARMAFRRRQPPNGVCRLFREISEIEPNASIVESILQGLGRARKTFIAPPRTAQDRELQVWGEPMDVEITIRELIKWKLDKAPRPRLERDAPRGKQKFADVPSAIGEKQRLIQMDFEQKAHLSTFQQNPDPETIFDYNGIYAWPKEEIRGQALFGRNLEAFDYLRSAYRSHIVFDNELQAIRTYSNDEGAAQAIWKVILAALQEFIARLELDNFPTSIVVVDGSKCKPGSRVCLRGDYNMTSRIPIDFPVLLQPAPNEDFTRESQNSILSTNLIQKETFQKALVMVLRQLQMFRGNITMKVSICDVGLAKRRWPKGQVAIPLEDFTLCLKEPSTIAVPFKRCMTRTQAQKTWKTIQVSDSLFAPIDPAIWSLRYVIPSFKARVTFLNNPAIVYEVEMDYGKDKKHPYSKTSHKWINLKHNSRSFEPIKIFMNRLGGKRSWMLEITRENMKKKETLPYLSRMQNFENDFNLKPFPLQLANQDGRMLFEWPDYERKRDRMPVKSLTQRITYQYRVKNIPGAVLTVARYDKFNNFRMRPAATHWAAWVTNVEWGVTFSRNQSLQLGEEAPWAPEPETFFPSASAETDPGIAPGLTEFLSGMEEIVALLEE